MRPIRGCRSRRVCALGSLKDEGLIARVGLCNVTVGQIEEARQITEIAAVQVEVSVWHDENLLNGVVEDWWVSMGVPWKVLFGERRIGLPTVRFEVDFRAPAFLEDELRFSLSIKRIGSKSVELDHVVQRNTTTLWQCAQSPGLKPSDGSGGTSSKNRRPRFSDGERPSGRPGAGTSSYFG